MRASKPITVTLGKQQASLEAHLVNGNYESASEVLRAGLRALDREKKALDEVMRARIQEALDDPRPSVPADEVFRKLRKRMAKRVEAEKRHAAE
jgi:antitoxin ParD1/3/4